ncbi:MAG: response regulator [Magnetococcales bacterium]|nr:response regulator [Magnetococcales bacterium]
MFDNALIDRRNSLPRILIVDDNPADIKLLIGILSELGRIQVATDGAQVLSLVKNHPPDLVLLEVRLPGMDGFEVCRSLKSEPETRIIPVIFITAHDTPQGQDTGLECGAIDYIAKPFNPRFMRMRIGNQLRQRDEERMHQRLCLQQQLILDAIGEGIIGFDHHCRITLANPAATRLLGAPEADLLGLRLQEMTQLDRIDGTPFETEQCVLCHRNDDSVPSHRGEALFRNRNGMPFPVEYTTSMVRHEGRRLGCVVVLRDISRQQEMELRYQRRLASRIAINALLETSVEPMSMERQLDVALEIILSVSWLPSLYKGAFFLVNHVTGHLEMVASKGLSPEAKACCAHLAPGECLCGQAGQTRQLVFAGEDECRHYSEAGEDLHHGHICVPLTDKEQLIGVVTIPVKPGHKPDTEELAFLTTLSKTLTSIIGRRRLEQKVNATQPWKG